MFSGNHAAVHPLDTLLEAARELDGQGFRFLFVGGGERVRDVSAAVRRHRLRDVRQIPHQPRAGLAASLASADLHIVVMGNSMHGLGQPSKMYGVLAAGAPYVFLGPKGSFVSDMLADCPYGFSVEHGNVAGLVAAIRRARALSPGERQTYRVANRDYLSRHFGRSARWPNSTKFLKDFPPSDTFKKSLLRAGVLDSFGKLRREIMTTDGCTIPAPREKAPARVARRLPRLSGSEWALLLVLATVQFMHLLDFVIMMPLGPKLQADLHISHEDFPSKFGAIVSAYGFSAGIMGLLAARLLDRFDRKKSLLVLFAGFTVGTFLCAIAPNYIVLLIGRAVAGGFAGVMAANVLTIVSDVFPESRRATAMGVVMSSFSVASIVGIYAGLELAEHFGWRSPFLVLAVLCLPVLAFAWYILPPLRRHLSRRPAHGVSLREVIFHTGHLRAYALTSSLILGSWMVIPALAIYLVKNLHWPDADLRWVWLVGGVATLLTMTPTGWLADRFDKLTVFRIIGVVSVIPVLLVTNMPELPMAAVLLITTLFMVSTSIRWVPVMAMITTLRRAAPPGHFHERQLIGAATGDGPGLLFFRPTAGRTDGRGRRRRRGAETGWLPAGRPGGGRLHDRGGISCGTSAARCQRRQVSCTLLRKCRPRLAFYNSGNNPGGNT